MIVGSIGVGLLLLAFALNLSHRLSERSVPYLTLNVLGAALAAWYAVDSRMWPFVILEAVWAVTALVRLPSALKAKSPR
ncbi:MAG: hypothetical protein KKA42_04410 [candidate division Zixibacteria bacterium]|nr:hypothetical protein [candidate division Zixibacteria bacterium]